jgi:hypothetical protein
MNGANQNKRLRELNQELETAGCLEVYSRLVRFTHSQRIFLGNYADLENAVARHNNITPLLDYHDKDTQFIIKDHIFEFMRHLHNTVAAAFSLVDHTRVFYRRFYRDSNQIPDYDAQAERRFLKHGLTQFVIHLRQFCQHYRNVNVVSTALFDNEHGRHSRIISLSKDDLMEFDGWNSSAKKYLGDLPERIDILIILRAYKEHIMEFYDWFTKCLEEIHREDFATYHRIMDEIECYRPPDLPLKWPTRPQRSAPKNPGTA